MLLTMTVTNIARASAYHGGVVSLIEVLQADDGPLRASDTRVQASTKATRAAIAAFKALGGSWRAAPTTLAQQRG
jgi:outer membrane protein TolC